MHIRCFWLIMIFEDMSQIFFTSILGGGVKLLFYQNENFLLKFAKSYFLGKWTKYFLCIFPSVADLSVK